MPVVPGDWTPQLASAVAAALREFGASGRCTSPLVVLDVGCFPWHGSVELSALTAADLSADPVLAEPGEQAAWPHYNLASGLSAWAAADEPGRRMQEAYYADDEARAATAEAYMRACAAALATPQVTAALESLARDPRFRVRVAHPDSGREFWPPEG
ncbi:hypothetical protein J0H58_35770 [bacterium]|nr:hypothetical protein [bacterium]